MRPRGALGRQPAALVAVALLLALLSGCAAVPSSGPVVQGGPGGEVPAPAYVRVIAEGPQPGDDPQQVVEGFFTAMASYEPGYPTARQFLTPQAGGDWEPEAGIAVYDLSAAQRTIAGDGEDVRVTYPQVGEVGADDAFVSTSPAVRQTLDLRLSQVGGQWRIENPPPGVLMSSFDFDREFLTSITYFFDKAGTVLVPDLVRLPTRGNTATEVVQRLLAGPTQWLSPAVRSAIPAGTELVTGEVPVRESTARVELSAEAAAASPQQRERLAAQIVWTLRQVPGVEQVAITAGDRPLVLSDDSGEAVAVTAFDRYDAGFVPAANALYVVADRRVAMLVDGVADAVDGPLGASVASRSVGVAFSAEQAAVVTTDGTALVRAPIQEAAVAQTVLAGRDLSPPSWDRSDNIWVVDRTREGSAVSRVSTAVTQAVPADQLAPRRVTALRIGPDGVRAAAVVRQRGRTSLLIGLVLLRGEEASLGRFREVLLPGADPIAAAWASPTSLALLMREETTGDIQPYALDLATQAFVPRGELARAATVAAAPGAALVVGLESAAVVQQDPLLEWVELGPGRAPAYPG